MRIRYHEDTDTAYIYLREEKPGEPPPRVDEAEEVAPGVIVDFDEEDRPVGVEIYEGPGRSSRVSRRAWTLRSGSGEKKRSASEPRWRAAWLRWRVASPAPYAP